MKAYQREILIVIVAVIATALAVWYFFGSMEKEKIIVQTNVYRMLDSSPSGLLVVNRPAVFSRMMLSEEKIKGTFATYIPEVYLDIVKQHPSFPVVIFSFHEQGVVMYAKTDEGEAYLIHRNTLRPVYNTYRPPLQKKNGITFTYYPDAENRFLGCYYWNGVWVASYSKRLLEEAARRQWAEASDPEATPSTGIQNLVSTLDGHAPLNVVLPASRLDLYVQINDSLEWRIKNKWLTADIYTEAGRLCCMGAEPYHAVLDSLYPAMADTLSLRLEHFFPQLQINTQVDIGQETVYFTACGS